MKKDGYALLSDMTQRFLGLLVITVAIFLALGSFQTGLATTTEKSSQEPAVVIKSMENTWGIRIQWIRLSAAGYMLDFRYRVIDPDKAKPLFVRKTKPYLIDQASNAKLMVPNPPKVGPLRNSNKPQANKIYFMFFGNPGKFVKAGNKVTVVIGDFKAENLTVE